MRGRKPVPMTLVVGHQISTWVWLDRVEEALDLVLKGVWMAKREVLEANKEAEGLSETPPKPS